MLTQKQKEKARVALVIGIIAVALVAGSIYLMGRPPSFKQGFKEIQEIEAKYNGNFRFEKVNDTAIKEENFDLFIEELEEYSHMLARRKNTTGAQALTKFINARTAMLKSEKFFKLGDNIGNIGKVLDHEGFKCDEMDYILNAAYYFNRSWTHGINALLELDSLLYDYRKVPNMRELVGIDDTKTKFYKSDLRMVKHQSTSNIYSLAYYCGYTGGAPAYLRPFERIAAPQEKRVVPIDIAGV